MDEAVDEGEEEGEDRTDEVVVVDLEVAAFLEAVVEDLVVGDFLVVEDLGEVGDILVVGTVEVLWEEVGEALEGLVETDSSHIEIICCRCCLFISRGINISFIDQSRPRA